MPWPYKNGLNIRVADDPPQAGPISEQITEEAGITADWDDDFRVEPLVKEGDIVAQGAPVLRSRRHPEIVVTAPMAARVATIGLGAGRRLSQIVFFREAEAGRHAFDTGAAHKLEYPEAVRELLQQTGMWRLLRSRPFGQVPHPGETPSAIVVMALDTRPSAPDPRIALKGRENDLDRGLRALAMLTSGPIFFCQDMGSEVIDRDLLPETGQLIRSPKKHPWGLAGHQVHTLCPALTNKRVWDVHAEDVANIGTLLETGLIPETRLISVTGPELREQRLVRCQPGADLRGLSYGLANPGQHSILSGSALDGHEARWLGLRDRQTTVIEGQAHAHRHHWFLSALQRASRPLPVIPTAAVDQAMGGVMPAVALLRAIASGDSETATRLGVLSLLPEDLTLIDYVTGAGERYSDMLATLLARIAAEEGL